MKINCLLMLVGSVSILLISAASQDEDSYLNSQESGQSVAPGKRHQSSQPYRKQQPSHAGKQRQERIEVTKPPASVARPRSIASPAIQPTVPVSIKAVARPISRNQRQNQLSPATKGPTKQLKKSTRSYKITWKDQPRKKGCGYGGVCPGLPAKSATRQQPAPPSLQRTEPEESFEQESYEEQSYEQPVEESAYESPSYTSYDASESSEGNDDQESSYQPEAEEDMSSISDVPSSLEHEEESPAVVEDASPSDEPASSVTFPSASLDAQDTLPEALEVSDEPYE